MDIYIDCNVVDFLARTGIDLVSIADELRCRVRVTPKVEYEIDSIPPRKVHKREVVRRLRDAGHLKPDYRFGYRSVDDPESGRFVGGYGSLDSSKPRADGSQPGRFSGAAEVAFEAQNRHWVKGTRRPTGFQKNEADLSLAAMATHSVVLTADAKPGPLAVAAVSTVTVIDLNSLAAATSDTLRDAIASHVRDV